ncbi:hypothetical protein HanXRQr2_Chr01g0020821 [Helianthus annuus]|uniref:Transmembrane protein n=1 Tax=Helianthus annuus TaxID=4232 RepID=A0A9K3JWQ6_HELAN|nr:hypothetical protein HanXRQr2_Chr01g0020821 [Helianthus annuus]
MAFAKIGQLCIDKQFFFFVNIKIFVVYLTNDYVMDCFGVCVYIYIYIYVCVLLKRFIVFVIVLVSRAN